MLMLDKPSSEKDILKESATFSLVIFAERRPKYITGHTELRVSTKFEN